MKKGFSGGGMNMGNMLKQAQKMQQDMERMQAELVEREYTASSGGGAVTVTVTGKKEVKSMEIKPDVVDPEDVEMLADMITAAVNEALRQAEENANSEMKRLTGGMNMPGMF